jgi:flavin-binding protein dodecin
MVATTAGVLSFPHTSVCLRWKVSIVERMFDYKASLLHPIRALPLPNSCRLFSASELAARKGAPHVSVAKVIEITSTSPGSFEDAIRKGIAKAQQSVEGIRGAWISEHKVEMDENGSIKHFRVDMKLTFVLE